MPRSLQAALLAALAAFHAAPAAAIDGEVLLTQEKALAGNITPGDTPGYPITISLPGSYKLGGNLNVTAGKSFGISVRASNVTIDFAGFRLSGNEVVPHGVDGRGRGRANQVLIKNGTIEDFERHGIYGEEVDHWTIDNMRVRSNGQTGILARVTGGQNLQSTWTIINSQVTENGIHGINASSYAVVRNSVVSGNGIAGIFADRGQIEGNLIAGNGFGDDSPFRAGAIVYSDGMVLGNTIIDNALFGLRAGATVGYGNNTFSGNNNGGAQVTGGIQMHPNSCPAGPC